MLNSLKNRPVLKIYTPNPYEPPEIEPVKYKEPLVDWGLAVFAFTVLYLPFIIIISIQIIRSLYLYYTYLSDI